MSHEIAAERLLVAADRADPERAARLVFQAFVALSRTADSHQMLPLLARVRAAREADRSARTELIYRTLAGTAATRARLAEGPAHLDTAVRLFDANAFGDDPVLVECALTAVMTLMRPDEARRFAPLVAALDLAPADRARLLALIGVGDAWAGNLVRGQAELREAARLAALSGTLDVQAEATSWLAKCDALRGDLDQAAVHLDRARALAARVGSAWVARHLPECTAALAFARGDRETWAGLLELVVATDTGVTAGLQYEHRWELATHHALTGRPEVAADLLAGVDDPPASWPGGSVLPAWRSWILDPDAPTTVATLTAALTALTRPAEQLLAARIAWLLGVHHGRAGRRGNAARLLEQACAGYARTGAGGMLALVVRDLRLLAGPPATTGTADPPSTATTAGPPGTAAIAGPPGTAGPQAATTPAAGPPATAPTAGVHRTAPVAGPAAGGTGPVGRSATVDARPGFAGPTGRPVLTGAEARVAATIADGLSNREAAQRLFVSVKTIEFHLGNIFRKLGVRNRTELAARRVAAGWSGSDGSSGPPSATSPTTVGTGHRPR
ncbi:helix-turn-helix domain-containing protein [Micromonospora cathayae]|uniref:Helix-turn-helix transcriptional regulator n=1 Tax=Micromonospora cathayae TaxID=3028804 RepID=A0ABY7ZL63_9ACTN|nr:helix-turn-helix transcriptional regulator [Micromonospora sp. HUAS 3]WDZ83704.1 helix-turn-helix transcriptional regulator [Micromonospora sp. HUAS 3]